MLQKVLGFFDFDRNFYSKIKRNNGKREWRWYKELNEQRARDIDTVML